MVYSKHQRSAHDHVTADCVVEFPECALQSLCNSVKKNKFIIVRCDRFSSSTSPLNVQPDNILIFSMYCYSSKTRNTSSRSSEHVSFRTVNHQPHTCQWKALAVVILAQARDDGTPPSTVQM